MTGGSAQQIALGEGFIMRKAGVSKRYRGNKSAHASAAGHIVVVVVNQEKPEKKESFSFKKAVVAVLATATVGVVAASIAYGTATGDYSIVKSIAESGKDIIVEVASKIATKPKEH